ncbi:hypothetical protein MKEN_00201200 [Mycena kentingensis (nom. inval.)]|nr:hypothetical protein MKEN_00201200 [Mycena kentingensis (nom. inval.)]
MAHRGVAFSDSTNTQNYDPYPSEGPAEGMNWALCKGGPFTETLDFALSASEFAAAVESLLDRTSLSEEASVPNLKLETVDVRVLSPAASAAHAIAKVGLGSPQGCDSASLSVRDTLLQLHHQVHRATAKVRGGSILRELGEATLFYGIRAPSRMKPHEWEAEFCARAAS